MSNTKPQIQEAQGTQSRINYNKTTLRHIIFKLQKIKDKEKTWKKSEVKKNKNNKNPQHLTYRGAKIRITSNYSSETMQTRREWNETFKVLRGKKHQPRILYPAKLTFKGKGEIDFLRQTKIERICCP